MSNSGSRSLPSRSPTARRPTPTGTPRRSPARVSRRRSGRSARSGSRWRRSGWAARRRRRRARIDARRGLTDLLSPDTWCAATWRGDGHPDHDAVGRAAATACDAVGCRLLEYPVWMWHWARPGEVVGPVAARLVDPAAHHGAPGEAGCHRPLRSRPNRRRPCCRTTSSHTGDGRTRRCSDNRGLGKQAARLILPAALPRLGRPVGVRAPLVRATQVRVTLAALPRARYRRALEPGCSIGVLTALLATRCDEIVATDVVDDALAGARARVAEMGGRVDDTVGHVDCRRWAFGSDWGSLGRFRPRRAQRGRLLLGRRRA